MTLDEKFYNLIFKQKQQQQPQLLPHFLPYRIPRPGLYKKYDHYTGCPTRYRTWHFFKNSNTNEDIGTKFEQEYVMM